MKFVSQVVAFFRYILSVFIRVHLWFPSFSFRVVGVFRGLNFRIMELGPGGGALTKVGQCVSPVGVARGESDQRRSTGIGLTSFETRNTRDSDEFDREIHRPRERRTRQLPDQSVHAKEGI